MKPHIQKFNCFLAFIAFLFFQQVAIAQNDIIQKLDKYTIIIFPGIDGLSNYSLLRKTNKIVITESLQNYIIYWYKSYYVISSRYKQNRKKHETALLLAKIT